MRLVFHALYRPDSAVVRVTKALIGMPLRSSSVAVARRARKAIRSKNS
jgi:hypothetical protein